MWVAEKLPLHGSARNAIARAVRFVAVTSPSPTIVPAHPPSRPLIWLLTIATGVSVANLY